MTPDPAFEQLQPTASAFADLVDRMRVKQRQLLKAAVPSSHSTVRECRDLERRVDTLLAVLTRPSLPFEPRDEPKPLTATEKELLALALLCLGNRKRNTPGLLTAVVELAAKLGISSHLRIRGAAWIAHAQKEGQSQ
ncbi:MAG: hypothetical protein JWO38_4900 [Gemmataceae bacterium]|nr:hypothetical protein [Gemmataceae bacterium]